MSNEGLSEALKQRLASFKNSMGHMVTDGVMPIMEPIGRAYDRFAGAPTRAALAELQAGRGFEAATPAFMNQFGNESVPGAATMKDMAETAGVPDTALSEALPDMYSDTGEEWNKLQRGGMLDPTASGTFGAIASMGTDPGMLASAGMGAMGKLGKGAALDTALMNDAEISSQAIKQRAAAKMPVVAEAKNTVAPFELPKGLPTDAEGLEQLVKKGAPKTGAKYHVSEDLSPKGNAVKQDPIYASEDLIPFPTDKVQQNYLPKDADVIDMQEALKRRDLSKSTPLDVVDEEIMPMPVDYKADPHGIADIKATDDDFFKDVKLKVAYGGLTKEDIQRIFKRRESMSPKVGNWGESDYNPSLNAAQKKELEFYDSLVKQRSIEDKMKGDVTPFPKDKVRDPIKEPIPPGVDPEEFQAYAESPMAEPGNPLKSQGFSEAKKRAIEDLEAKQKYKSPNKKAESDVLARMKALDEEIATYDPNSPDLDPLLQEKLDLDKEHSNLRLRNPPKEDLSGADPIQEASRGKVLESPFAGNKKLSKQNKYKMKDAPYTAKDLKKEKAFFPLKESIDASGLTDKQQAILNRFSPDESSTAKKLADVMRTPHDQPYIGNRDVHGSIYATPSNAHVKMPDIGIPAVPANTSLEQLPKIMGKRILGKDVAKANMDPLPYMDRRYGVSKNLIEESNKSRTPMQINTRSDLIAMDDYLKQLDPKLHDVHLYLGPTNDDMHRLVNPGMASTLRMQRAAEALEKAGIKPTIHLDTFPDVKNPEFTKDIKAGFMRIQKEHPGVRIVENPIKFTPEMKKAFKEATGIDPDISGDWANDSDAGKLGDYND